MLLNACYSLSSFYMISKLHSFASLLTPIFLIPGHLERGPANLLLNPCSGFADPLSSRFGRRDTHRTDVAPSVSVPLEGEYLNQHPSSNLTSQSFGGSFISHRSSPNQRNPHNQVDHASGPQVTDQSHSQAESTRPGNLDVAQNGQTHEG